MSKDITKRKVDHLFTAEEFKAYRLSLGHTQKSFAKAFKIPMGTIRNWEQGLCLPVISVQKFKVATRVLAFKRRKIKD